MKVNNRVAFVEGHQYFGAVGDVVAVEEGQAIVDGEVVMKTKVLVHIEGQVNEAPLMLTEWFNADELKVV